MKSKNILNKTIESLGFFGVDGLYYFSLKDTWAHLPSHIRRALNALEPFAFYCLDSKPFILFFKKPTKISKIEQIHIGSWNFQVPVVIVISSNEVEVYNGYSINRHSKVLDKLIDHSKDLKDFSFWSIRSVETWLKYQDQFEKKRIDDFLLDNIKTATELLEKNDLARKVANKLILRLIFTRYLIDIGVELDSKYIGATDPKRDLQNIINNKERLYDFFDYLREKFHGNLFDLEDGEKRAVFHHHLTILYSLFSGTQDLKSGVRTLFDLYDFKIIPIELISNIYERFIGDEKQKSDGAFYTPPFLVDYVLSLTVEPHLKDSFSCKTLDPSCGSGIFLVETLRKIIEKNKSEVIPDELLIKLLIENIFGIDKNGEAIDVAIFSLYITLLDYKNPKEIQSFKLPELKDKNFFIGDFFTQETHDFLVNQRNHKNFDCIIGNPPWGDVNYGVHKAYVDTINGNYSQSKSIKGSKKKEAVLISDYQIAQSFLIRTEDFVDESTKCGLIVTSKILYNIQASNFRKDYLLQKLSITNVLELSAVRKQIFKNAIGPSAILFYTYNKSNKNLSDNLIQHISLKPNLFFKYFKTIVAEKFDIKDIKQGILIQYDWLWKVMLYGNVLDFNFIKRLKNDFQTVNDVIRENTLRFGVGLKRKDGNKRKDASELKGISFLDTNIANKKTGGHAKQFDKYLLAPQTDWEEDYVGNLPNIDLFRKPAVLLKKGLKPDFSLVSAYSTQDLIFTDSVTAIKGEENDSDILKMLTGLFNSTLFTYYIFSVGSSTATEREQSHNEEERFTFPVALSNSIINFVDTLQKLYQTKNRLSDNQKIQPSQLSFSFNSQEKAEEINSQIEAFDNRLNNLLNKLYNISDTEIAVIKYAIEVSIPLHRASGKRKGAGFKSWNALRELKKPNEFRPYIDVFINHFSEIFNEPGHFFEINIYPRIQRYFSAIEFKVVPDKPSQIINVKTENDVLSFYNKFTSEIVSKNFFIQKDIKGFEADSFYIIKPNEFKNWHPAIAYLDLSEFLEHIKEANEID